MRIGRAVGLFAYKSLVRGWIEKKEKNYTFVVVAAVAAIFICAQVLP